jgi:hypothetical protein
MKYPKSYHRAREQEEKEFQEALVACGVTKNGEALARVIWRAAGEIFAGAPEEKGPFNIADLSYRLFRAKASDVERARREKKARS